MLFSPAREASRKTLQVALMYFLECDSHLAALGVVVLY